MSGRLDAIKALVLPAKRIADVGCDHARIAEYCVNCGIAESVVASDISEQCLNKARARLGNADNVTFVCCDGIKYDCDEAVIAGMGGLLIMQILESATCLPETLVLCPHRDCYAVRSKLTELGYTIDVDTDICDRGKFYSVMRAVRGTQKQALSELQLLFGVNVAKDSAVLKARLKKLYYTYMQAPESNALKISQVKAAAALQGMTL